MSYFQSLRWILLKAETWVPSAWWSSYAVLLFSPISSGAYEPRPDRTFSNCPFPNWPSPNCTPIASDGQLFAQSPTWLLLPHPLISSSVELILKSFYRHFQVKVQFFCSKPVRMTEQFYLSNHQEYFNSANHLINHRPELNAFFIPCRFWKAGRVWRGGARETREAHVTIGRSVS